MRSLRSRVQVEAANPPSSKYCSGSTRNIWALCDWVGLICASSILQKFAQLLAMRPNSRPSFTGAWLRTLGLLVRAQRTPT